MAAVVSAAVAAVEAIADISFTIGATTFTVGEIVTNIAISAALSYGASLLSPKPSLNASKQQEVFNNPVADRTRFLGQVRVGGPRSFLKAKDGWLYQIVMLNTGQAASFVEHFLGDDLITLDSTGGITDPERYDPDGFYAYINVRYGSPGQPAFSEMITAFTPDYTSDHRGRGIACALIRLKSPKPEHFTEVFPAGLPPYTAVLQAGLFWDPRDTGVDIDSANVDGTITTASAHGFAEPDSDDGFGNPKPGDLVIVRGADISYVNAAGDTVPLDGQFEVLETPSSTTLTLVGLDGETALAFVSAGTGIGSVTKCAYATNGVVMLADYLSHADGMRLPRAMIEKALDVWQDQADIADEAIDLAAGGTEPRYRLGGGYSLNAPPKSILPQFLTPMDARLALRADGAIIVDVGHEVAASVSLGDADILDYTELTRAREREELRNDIRAQFVSADYNFQPTDARPMEDAASIAIDGRQTAVMNYMSWCPSHGQCRRRMKVELARLNPDWSGKIVTNAKGLRLIDQRYVALTIAEFAGGGLDMPIDGLVFEIIDFKFNVLNGNCDLTISSIPEDIYDWDAETEEGDAPEGGGVGGDSTIGGPVFDIITSDAGFIDVYFDDPGRADLNLFVQRSIAHDPGDDDTAIWHDLTTDFQIHAYSGTLPNNDYDLRAKWVSNTGTVSAWTYERDVTVSGSA